MIDKIKKILSNKKSIVLLPESDKLYYECLNYMFDNAVILVDERFEDYNLLVNEINSKAEKIYFVNFFNLYRNILPGVNKNIEKNEIFLCNIGNLTSPFILPIFYDIIEFYERKLIDNIYALDDSAYRILKHANYNVFKFDCKLPFNKDVINTDCKKNTSIGIISNDYDPVHNFYNMLTAVSMVKDYEVVKFVPYMNASREFFNHFSIKHEFCDNLNDAMNNNFVNLYSNFTNTNPCLVIKSMDNGIPCILGNTDLFDNNKKLKELLVLKSDDDVNEIADKINSIRDNYDVIFKEYIKWRKDYV
ncbi:MAG: hypothetical protein J6D28_04800 [Bacilli bacterium]|nr:hypothetical protein [Bacilli bacterium]